MACIDQAPATHEYKLLQLRKHLSGEALKAVETLGHSAAAYKAAKERLERKFGGQRGKIALHLEELEAIKSVRPGNARDLERFADLLDVLVVNRKEVNRHEELGKGTLNVNLCKKLNESALAHYYRWMYGNGHRKSVETLKEFIVQEAEFQTVASETIRGVNTASKSFEQKRNRKDSERSTFFSRDQKTESHRKTAYMSRPCKVCNGPHGVWRCEKFKMLSVQERWDAAKRLHLCFHCLGGDHFGQTCVRTRICGINNCRDKHNRLLHTHRNQQQDGIEQIEEKSSQLKSDQNLPSGDTSAGNSNLSVESERKPLVVSLPQESADH